MPSATIANEGLSEEILLGYAAEYSFRGRMDKFNFTGPILERGSGSVVADTNGKEYLDFNSGQMCSALGHNNPRIVDAIKDSCENFDSREQQHSQCEGGSARKEAG